MESFRKNAPIELISLKKDHHHLLEINSMLITVLIHKASNKLYQLFLLDMQITLKINQKQKKKTRRDPQSKEITWTEITNR